MKWEKILGVICAAPSIVLDLVVTGFKEFFVQEKELYETDIEQDNEE